nr:hypothetical protein [Tanacetum cinerariifolium]
MAALEYCAKHNMIAYLEKIEENAQFHKIKFATFKTINNLSKINAKVAGKPVVITKASIRSDLLFNDVNEIECLTNEAIFENLALMGYEGDLTKITFQTDVFSPQWKFLIHTIIHCLSSKIVEEGKDSGTPTESQPTPSPTQPSVGDQPPLTESFSEHDTSQDLRMNLEGICGSGGDQVKLPYDSPLSGGHTSDRAEGSLNLEELSALYTNLSNRVLALETVKDAQAKEIITLMARIKKLEKRCKPSISHHRAWLKRPTKDDSAELDAKLEEDMEYIDTEEAVNEGRQSTVNTARPDDDTARPDVRTARQELSTVGPTTPPTTITIFDDEEMTLADTLIKLKDDKAKGVLEEPESAKKMTKSDFNAAQIAIQLEVELQAEVERERHGEEQVSMDYIANLYDKVQVRIDADHELAVRLTHEEHEKYTMVKREKLLAEYFERRKKKLAK